MEIKTVSRSGFRYLKFETSEIEVAKKELKKITGCDKISYYHNPHSFNENVYEKGKPFENFVYWESECKGTINPLNGAKGKGYKYISFCPKKIN